MKRVGIAPRWPRIWARTKKLIDIESVSDLSREVDELERYIETGITDLSREIDSEVEQVAVVPEYENWERNVFSPMISYATGLRYLFEKESEENKSWDLQFAARSFSAFRISFYSHFHTYYLFERRWGRKNPRLMRFEDVAMLSMGLIIGAKRASRSDVEDVYSRFQETTTSWMMTNIQFISSCLELWQIILGWRKCQPSMNVSWSLYLQSCLQSGVSLTRPQFRI